MRYLAVLVLLLAQAKADDNGAEELFKGMREKIDRAKCVRAESTLDLVQPGATYSARSSIKVKGMDRWALEIDVQSSFREQNRQHLILLFDGRRLVNRGSMEGMNFGDLNTEGMAEELRRSLAAPLFPLLMFGTRKVKTPTMGPVKDGGKEKIGECDARIIESTIKDVPGQEVRIRIFIDPSRSLPIRREMGFAGLKWVENFGSIELDGDLLDSDFTFQSKKVLARARAAQLATSVRLFGLYTGRHPQKLDDLLKRPSDLDAGVFWPSRGFVLGGAIPRDPWGNPFGLSVERGRVAVVSRGADGKAGGKGDDEDIVVEVPPIARRAIGAPTERLSKFYSARVEIQLLAAAVRAWRDTYGELLKKKSALWEKPEWADVWPEGGWLPGGAVPVDPWGEPYRIISDEGYVRVQVKDPKSLVLGLKSITAEEQKKLEEAARPQVSEEERRAIVKLIDQLGEDDLEARERAEAELKALGPGIVAVLDERLKKEKDGEGALRLAGIRKSFPARRAAWMTELAPLSVTVRAEDPAAVSGPADERTASACLKTIATAEADFRANDRDNNHINDYWTGDVASLYALVPKDGTEAIKLIELSVALADGAPLNDGAEIEKHGERQPRAGYWFQMMIKDGSSTPPEEYRKDTDGKGGPKTHHNSCFGVCAYPAEYGVTGKRTFILNEGNTVFWKDTGGEPLLEWPSDADLARGWSRLD